MTDCHDEETRVWMPSVFRSVIGRDVCSAERFDVRLSKAARPWIQDSTFVVRGTGRGMHAYLDMDSGEGAPDWQYPGMVVLGGRPSCCTMVQYKTVQHRLIVV